MNLYEWEAKATRAFESRGDAFLTWVLIAAAVAIFLIAVFSRNVIFKSLVAAYILLP